MSESVFQLVYVSSATDAVSQRTMADLLEVSRQNNAKLNITGLLLCYENNFFQLLEGEETAVKNLYKKISMDPRHKGILQLLADVNEGRDFPDWSMCYKLLDDSDDMLLKEGMSDIFQNGQLNLDDAKIKDVSPKYTGC